MGAFVCRGLDKWRDVSRSTRFGFGACLERGRVWSTRSQSTLVCSLVHPSLSLPPSSPSSFCRPHLFCFWSGLISYGLVWFGLIWFGLVSFDLVWRGVVLVVWFDLVWRGVV